MLPVFRDRFRGQKMKWDRIPAKGIDMVGCDMETLLLFTGDALADAQGKPYNVEDQARVGALKAPLTWHPDKQELWCRASRLAYPVRDGIPVMLEEEARPLADEELQAAR